MRYVYLPKRSGTNYQGMVLSWLKSSNDLRMLDVPSNEVVEEFQIHNGTSFVTVPDSGWVGTSELDGRTFRIVTNLNAYDYEIQGYLAQPVDITIIGSLTRTMIQGQMIYEVAKITYDVYGATIYSPLASVSETSYCQVVLRSDSIGFTEQTIDVYNLNPNAPSGKYYIDYRYTNPFYSTDNSLKSTKSRTLYMVDRDTRENIAIGSSFSQKFRDVNVEFGASVESGYSKDLSISTFNLISDGDNLVQNIYNILFTAPGERFNNPTFGCGLKLRVFHLMTDVEQSLMEEDVFSAIEKYEVRVRIDKAQSSVKVNQSARAIGIDLFLILPESNRRVRFILKT